MSCFLILLFALCSAVIMRRHLESWRVAALWSAIITASALTGITESLSLARSFSFYPLLISWLFITVLAVKMTCLGPGALSWPRVDLKTWGASEKILLGIIVLICAVCALTAAGGAPNTWDSMTYHLSRVEHWIQDKTVSFYPTNILRQLYSAPWAEYSVAQLRILGGGETIVNFVQWFSMAGSLLAVSLIAGQVGANRRGQLLAAAIASCLPMGVLQSVSTQTDYACTFWLSVFIFFLIESQRECSLLNAVAAGLSLGLAFLTKGYSYIFAAPFLIWLAGSNFKKSIFRKLPGLLLIIICAVGMNMGPYARNTLAFGSPVWSDVNLINGSFGPKDLGLNVLRNMRIQMTTSWMDVNKIMTRVLTRAARWMGADVADPQAIFGDDLTNQKMNLDEDYAGNCLHTAIFLIVFILAWFYRGAPRKMIYYVCTLLAASLIFCLIVRYEPWNGRFHLPFYVLFCPVAGVVLEHFLGKKSVVVALVLAAGVLPWLLMNDQHPWFGGFSIWRQPKSVQYYYKNPYLIQPYAAAAGYIKSVDCRQIGLVLGQDDWEYPWWVLLAGQGARIEHVGVDNRSASLKYPLGDFTACALIVSGGDDHTLLSTGNAIYRPAWWVPVGYGGRLTVYLRKL